MTVTKNSTERMFKARSGALLVGRRLCGWALPFAMALGLTAISNPALARTKYDGDWSVLTVTRRGACEPAFRYGLQIADGTIISNAGGAAAVQGRVSPTGRVRVTVRSGNEWAEGSGHLTRNRGGGVWRGEGTSGACYGTWVAQRREFNNYAGENQGAKNTYRAGS